MKSDNQKRWAGGYVRHGKRGRAYVIERWIDGRRFHVSTKCRTERAALEQLAVFETDPSNYKPNRAQHIAATPNVVTLDDVLVPEYIEWMRTRPQPASPEHVIKHGQCLKKWTGFYGLRDLRSVPLKDVSAWLGPQKDKPMKIQALKAFCSWLRQEKFLLKRAEDPSLDLRRPPPRATKDSRQVAIDPTHLLKVLPLLPEETRDVVILRMGTGWHEKEAARFATEGVIHLTPGKTIWLMQPDAPLKVPLLATLEVRQKNGRQTNTPILHEEHLAAAQRIQARQYTPHRVTQGRHIAEACAKAGVPRFLNWHLRHSVVSYAVNQGADLEQASVFVDHLNIDTTRIHYKQVALPKKAVPVLRVIDGQKAS